MRIAVVNWTGRKAGGVESYLHAVVPALAGQGHEVAFWHELDAPRDREQVPLPDGSPRWCAAELGAERALRELRGWRPELIFAHGLHDPSLEEQVAAAAPGVCLMHAYFGTCISGEKAFKLPRPTPCSRRFGWGCLLRYYPRRCGGLNPVTMARQYRAQARRLRLLRHYRALATFSEHMRHEYLRHGFPPERVTTLPYMPPEEAGQESPRSLPLADGTLDRGSWHLLFPGRMEPIKGGRTLLEALPLVRAALPDRPLHVTFAGDGTARAGWQREAERLQARRPGLTVEFTGWVGAERLEELYAGCDLVVVPSLWPEPFGQVGPEAFRRGVPVAAFAVGGIPEWLRDGVNGHLAPGDPPTAAGLAEAVVKCLRDPRWHAKLRRGAWEEAARFARESHLSALQRLFYDTLGEAPCAGPLRVQEA